MPFVEYSGEIVSGKRDPFKKDESGYTLPTQEEYKAESSNDWWQFPLGVGAAAGAGAAAVGYGLKKLAGSSKSPEMSRVEPTYTQPDIPQSLPNATSAPTTATENPIEARRLSRLKEATSAINNPPADTGATRVPTPTNTQPAPQAVSTEIPSITSKEGGDQLNKVLQRAEASKQALQPVAPPQSITPTTTTSAPAAPAQSVVPPTKAEAEAARAALNSQRIESRLNELVYRPQETAAVKKYITENPLDPKVMNWLHSNMGPETAKVAQGAGLGPQSPIEDAYAAARAYREGKLPAVPRKEGASPLMGPESKRGGESFGKPPANWLETQRGQITPSMALNLLGNALGIAGNVESYKKGKKTGDWSDLGLGIINQIIANAAPKAALPVSLMTPSTLNANEAEELARRRLLAPTMQ